MEQEKNKKSSKNQPVLRALLFCRIAWKILDLGNIISSVLRKVVSLHFYCLNYEKIYYIGICYFVLCGDGTAVRS